MWQKITVWFHRFASLKWFYQTTSNWHFFFAILSLCLLVIGGIWGLFFAPADYLQGNSYRIIFIHVPTAFLAQFIYIVMAISAGIYVVWKITMADYIIQVSTTIGAVMTGLALVTGAIWGKPTWGTYWQWDARVTTMFILFLLYLGIAITRASIANSKSASFAVALLALVGVINIPIIKYSVDWWFTLHQPASLRLTSRPAMPAVMWIPLFIMIAGFYCVYGWYLLIRLHTLIMKNNSSARWLS